MDERVNITSDGALEIYQVNLRDSGQYMCTVKTINHSSPGIYHTTLVVTNDGKLKLCVWLLVDLSNKLFASGCSNTTRSGRYLLEIACTKQGTRLATVQCTLSFHKQTETVTSSAYDGNRSR